jgi:hypothetical protein
MLRQLTIFVVLNLIVQRPSLAQTDTTKKRGDWQRWGDQGKGTYIIPTISREMNWGKMNRYGRGIWPALSIIKMKSFAFISVTLMLATS